MKKSAMALIYLVLVGGIVLFAFGLFGVLESIVEKNADARGDAREDIVWHTSQIRNELRSLIETLVLFGENEPAVTHDDVVDRFDVFWSRIDQVEKGEVGDLVMALPPAPAAIDRSRFVLSQIEPQVLGLESDDAGSRREILRALIGLTENLNALALAASEHRRGVMLERKLDEQAEVRTLLTFFAGVVVLGATLVILLLVQKLQLDAYSADLGRQVAARTRELAQSEERYRTLVEHAPEAIVVFDAGSGAFVDFNDNACRLFRTTPETLEKMGPVALSPPMQPGGSDSAGTARAMLDRAIGGESPTFEWMHRDVEGNDIPCEVTLTRLPSSGAPLVRGSIVDISERKRIEAELARYRDRLEDLVAARTSALEDAQADLLRSERLAAIGQLVGTVGHELRSPLATLSTSFEIVRRNLGGDEEAVARSFERIERSLARCDATIEELLDYTRARELDRVTLDLDACVSRILDDIEIPPEVALERALASGATTAVDRERLAQALHNVVLNAVQALVDREPAEPPGRVRVASRCRPGRCEIVVSDNGPGVPEDIRGKVFEPLYSSRSGGVGLGLPLVRRIMEQHGGGVDLQDADGPGATFVLWLPDGEAAG